METQEKYVCEIEFKKDFEQLKSEFERHNLDLNEDYKKIMYAILKEIVKSRKVRLKLNSTKTPFIPQIQLSIEDILRLAELDNTKENEKLVRKALFALSVYNYEFIYDTIKLDDGSYKELNYYIAYTCVIFYIKELYDDNNVKYYEIEPSAYVLELFKEYFVVYQNQLNN
jgi:hypothetical protein